MPDKLTSARNTKSGRLATDSVVSPSDDASAVPVGSPVDGAERAAILEELQKVLDSPAFKNSSRGKQLLSYLVLHKLDGDDELLKERVIGTEMFHRPADYATGEDPVVRVQMREVRRRLEQYYHEFAGEAGIRIELPVGTYSPEFRRASIEMKAEARVETVSPEGKSRHLLLWMAAAIVVLVLAVLLGWRLFSQDSKTAALKRFWAPALANQQPILIYLSKPVLYRPSPDLFRKYVDAHPDTFQTTFERLVHPLPLDPHEKLEWKDFVIDQDWGVAPGDVYAAFRIAGVLNRSGKSSQLRVGRAGSFDDLRNSPAVVVGAFSNRWTLEITSNLPYFFAEKDGVLWIQNRTVEKQRWLAKLGKQREVLEDYGVVSRLVDSKTGQLVVVVAGITSAGSDAAAQLISTPEYLAQALQNAPPDWQKKNMQVVVKAAVVDSVAGPPQVVATSFW